MTAIRHLPRGRCGLKFGIKIASPLSEESHLPRGRCGLKYYNHLKHTNSALSPSARKVWIEIISIGIKAVRWLVTFREEGVD